MDKENRFTSEQKHRIKSFLEDDRKKAINEIREHIEIADSKDI